MISPEQFISCIKTSIPEINFSIDSCLVGWWVDIEYDGHEVIVECSEDGYGISSHSPNRFVGYGERSDKYLDELSDVVDLVVLLLIKKAYT